MSIGSINMQTRKKFQKIAGGTKWRSKVVTVEDAEALIEKAKLLDPSEYVSSKIHELNAFVTYKYSCLGTGINLKDYRAKHYV